MASRAIHHETGIPNSACIFNLVRHAASVLGRGGAKKWSDVTIISRFQRFPWLMRARRAVRQATSGVRRARFISRPVSAVLLAWLAMPALAAPAQAARPIALSYPYLTGSETLPSWRRTNCLRRSPPASPRTARRTLASLVCDPAPPWPAVQHPVGDTLPEIQAIGGGPPP